MTDFSFQLYSARNFPPLGDILSLLGSLGYKAVEGYGALYADLRDLDTLKGQLDAAGLTMRSGHFSLDMIEDSPEQVMEICAALGTQQVYAPHIAADRRPTNASGWRDFGARLAAAGAPLRNEGLTFGWHNHDFEFTPLPDGNLPIDLMLEDNDLAFEFDVAWAAVAGADPLSVIAKYGDRITAAHVKDRAAEGQNANEDGWADVGHGTLDWPTLFTALKAAGVGNFVMEHDNPSDAERFAKRSLAYMQSL